MPGLRVAAVLFFVLALPTAARAGDPPPLQVAGPTTPSPPVATQPPPQVATQPSPAVATQPPPAVATQPPPAVATQPPPAVATQPPPPVVTQPPPVDVKRSLRRCEFGASSDFSGGAAFVRGRPLGGYGRARTGILWAYGDCGHRPSFGIGYGLGLEAWGTRTAGGAGMPIEFEMGLLSEHVVALLSVGHNLIDVDRVDRSTRLWWLAPRAGTRIGFRRDNIFVLADGGAQYRWMLGKSGVPLLQAGLSIGWRFRG
jgi:hypothetical protein